MASVTCERCSRTYDDTYRLTYCPHDKFEMHTLAVRGDGQEKLCTSVEELHEFLGVGNGQAA